MAKKQSKRKKAVRRQAADTDDFFRKGEPASGFNNLPEGTYEGYIKAGSAIIEPKDSGGHRASCTLVVTSPQEHEEREQVKRNDLSTQVGVNIFLGELKTLGFDQPKNVKEAAEMLAETDNVPVRFWVSPPQDDYPPKVRFNERLEGNGGPSEAPSAEEEYYTREEILAMDEEKICALNKEEELGLDPDDYDTWEEFNEACATEYGV